MRGWVGRDWSCSEAAAVFGRGGDLGGTGCKEISGGVRKAEPSEAVLGVGGAQHVVSESDSLSLYASCFLLNCRPRPFHPTTPTPVPFFFKLLLLLSCPSANRFLLETLFFLFFFPLTS